MVKKTPCRLWNWNSSGGSGVPPWAPASGHFPRLNVARSVAVNNFPIRLVKPSPYPPIAARLFGIAANDLNALIYAGFSTFIIKDMGI